MLAKLELYSSLPSSFQWVLLPWECLKLWLFLLSFSIGVFCSNLRGERAKANESTNMENPSKSFYFTCALKDIICSVIQLTYTPIKRKTHFRDMIQCSVPPQISTRGLPSNYIISAPMLGVVPKYHPHLGKWILTVGITSKSNFVFLQFQSNTDYLIFFLPSKWTWWAHPTSYFYSSNQIVTGFFYYFRKWVEGTKYQRAIIFKSGR